MSDIKDWKDTAASNNASPPDGWPEGQAPSTVNNCAREMMRAIRVKWENAGFFDWGLTYSLKSQNKLRISDQSAGSSYAATDVYSVGQRVKIVSNNATVYGAVTTLSSSSTAVIIDITCDSGTLTSTITSVEASILYPGENPLSGYNAIDQNSSQIYGADGGSANTYTLTLAPAPTAYAAGQVFHFNATNANTGTSTLNVNGLGAKTIKKLHDQDVVSGDIEAGQVVTVIYDGTNFQMQSQAGAGTGSLVLLATATASASAQIDFTSNIDSTYDEYEIHLLNVLPATDNTDLWMRTSTDGGSTFDSGTSDYAWCVAAYNTTGAVDFAQSGQTRMILNTPSTNVANTSGYGACGVIRLIQPSAATLTRVNWVLSHVGNAGLTEVTVVNGTGLRDSAADVDAVRFLFNSGNIASGEFKLYGVKK